MFSVVDAAAAASSNGSNLQSISDFWLFVVYCLVVIVVVIFFLFYFNRVLAQVLTFLINQYTWRKYNAYIEVDSIRVSLLGGRILFKNLRYLSTNQSVSIVKGHIAIRYWLLNVRKSEDDKIGKTKDLPCRIICNVEGLEWFFYNNTPAYNKMKDVLGLSVPTTNTTSTMESMEPQTSSEQEKLTTIVGGAVDPESQTPMNVDNNSLMERLMPFQFECTTGAIMIGNTELKSMLVWTVAQAGGTYSITKSRSSMDYYKTIVDVVLTKPQVSLKDNMDYTNVDENTERVIKPIPKTTFWTRLLRPFRILYPFTTTRRYGEMQHMRDIMREGRSSTENESESTTYHEEYARVNNVLECNEMAITYYQDYAGPVPAEASDASPGKGIDVGNGGLPPEWGIRISLWDATIQYGPWADRQRSAMQDYFFPSSHRGNIPTTRLRPGQQRVATSFETYIEFMNEGKLRIPTREKSKDWKYSSGTSDLDIGSDGYYCRPYGWIDLKTTEGSFVKVITQFACGPEGFVNTVDLVLKGVDITTSVNYASFIQTERIEISIKMPAPLQWNGYRHWNIKINPQRPTVFLLRDHIYLFQDTAKDWASTPPADLLHFTPITYTLQINLEKPTIYLCVNEHNVINNPNSIEDNAFIKIQAHRLAADVTLPFTEFQPDMTSVKFFVTAEHGSVALSLQTSHTLNAFMREDDARAAVAVHLTLEGSYDYFSTVDVMRHVESCNMRLNINGATVRLFGSLIRYIFLLKDNFFGAWNNFSTIDEYRRRKSNQQEWLEQKKRQAAAKPLADPFEVYLLLELEDGVLLLPENLYECSRYSQCEFQELQVEMRNLDVYLDLYVNISPITISRDSNPNPHQSKEGFFRIKNARDPKNYVYIDGLNVTAHRLFGPLPDCSTYLCHWEFDIGRITGEIKPSFLLGLACFGQSFAYNLIDEDNAVPQEMESKDLPDVTFLKLYVQEVDVCLMSMNSATNICLKEGILLEFDNLINVKYSQRITIKIPAILTRCLANPGNSRNDILLEENEYPWVEVAKADLGVNITVFRHTAVWKKKRADQQNFIRSQDYLTRRCVRLYEEADTTSQHSSISMRSVNDHHVGFIYVPPFRPFMFGRVEDKSVLYDSTDAYSNTGSDTPTGRYRGNSNAGSMASLHPSNHSEILYDDSGEESEGLSDNDMDDASYIARSSKSTDSESFHTAQGSDDEEYQVEDDYFMASATGSEYSGDDSSADEQELGQQQGNNPSRQSYTPDKNLTAAIPPSIPYSDYLRRYKVSRSNSEYHGGFFHPYIPPSRPNFIPENGYEDQCRPLYANSDEEPKDYFGGENSDRHTDSATESADTYGKGNEVIATTVIEATRAVTVLVTPILVKLIQELAEEIIKDDWNLETMLDARQMEYIEQLTRYLTDQYICTRFAVILPQTYLHFIQNVTLPDDLPSYKHGESFVKTQYNPESNVLCSADIFLNDFRMIGSVKFEDYAFDEKKKKVAESNLVLQESRVHIDVDDMGSTVQYISKQHEEQSIAFGIPYESLRNKKLYSNEDDEDTLVNELVMLDLAVKGFRFKWLGARTPNYAEMNVKSADTIIITESVEILVGAVYSWLVFVDDLKGILESFQDQRSRQVQVFINEIADFSITPGVVGDPLFLTTPTTMLRLGSRNFRNDVGWKLLARMRHCLRSMPLSKREQLQYRLTSGGALQDVSFEQMFANVVQTFSKWRNWEVGYEDISQSRLFTQPFKQKSVEKGVVRKNMTDEAVKFLSSSANFAKLRVNQFKFTIFEEETAEACKEENSISIGPFEFLLESLFKSSAIPTAPEAESSTEGARRSIAVSDGYLDIITKISLGRIAISANPIILAFARHMLLVQRVFTTKLRSLSLAPKTPVTTPNSSSAPLNAPESSSSPANNSETENQDFSFDALLSKVDVVAQALVSLDSIQLIAHAQELKMEATVSGVQGSALFSNPKLAPLQLLSPDRADSDTGSGKRSSNRASRKNTNNQPRLVLEAAGGINLMAIDFKEESRRNNVPTYNTLLGVMLEDANVNANISQITKPTKKNSKTDITKNVLNVFSNVHKFYVHVPQSLLRLYGFVESWQAEQGRRYHFMFQNLIKEWEEQRREAVAAVSPTASASTQAPRANTNAGAVAKKMDIKLQFLLNDFMVRSDLLSSLSAEYRIVDLFIMVNETHVKSAPVRMYAFQLSKQVIHLITRDTKKNKASKLDSSTTSSFSIPGIRSTGSLRTEIVKGVSQLKLRSMISVDIISMSLDVGMIDSLLTAQSLLGNEVSELVEVLSYSKNKKPATAPSSEDTAISQPTVRKFKYTFDISLNGLRVSAASPSALTIFRSDRLDASISNDNTAGREVSNTSDQLTWKLQARSFTLSLDHNTVEDIDNIKDDAMHRPNCLAYILIDFTMQNYSTPCSIENCTKTTHFHDQRKEFGILSVDFTKIQTVMQPIALGKLAEMYIYYDAELRKKKMMKKKEVDQLSANTKRIVQSISVKNEWPKVLQEEPHSLLEGKIISLRVHRLGVAIPLVAQSDIPSIESSRKSVSALLLSITSIEFLTKSIEKGALQLDNIALQFVKRFDQNNSEHFVAENHPRMNQISFPSVSCNVSATNIKPSQSIKIDAHVKGFEVDVDGNIADYINTLSIIYVKSKDRVDAFTAKANFNSKSRDHLNAATFTGELTPALESASTSEVVYLDIECKFDCDSGIIRMYPKRHSSDTHKGKRRAKTLRIRTDYDSSSEVNMATVEIPGLSAWLTYQTPLGAHATVVDAPKRFHADILIRESRNTLHPALAQFLREVVTGLKLGIQQSSERKADRDAGAENESNLNASLFLRLSRTQLDLTCQPSSKVLCSLGWEESEFLMNAFSQDTTSRTMSCVGSVREITAMVKHHFSPEACLNVRLDRISFNAMLTSQRKGGDSNDDISIIVELPDVSGDVNMRHLQDLLILNSCWFDLPIADNNVKSESSISKSTGEGEHLSVVASTSEVVSNGIDVAESQVNAITSAHPPAPFSKHVAICVRKMRFSADMGQFIGKITLAPENLSLQLHHVPHKSKGLSLSLEKMQFLSEGRLSGIAKFKRFIIQGRVGLSDVINRLKEKSSICVRSDGFKATFEYEYQNILDLIQQSVEMNVNLERLGNRYDLQISINLEALIAQLSVKTVPVVITMARKFDELLEKKKAEARVQSDYDGPYSKLNPSTANPSTRASSKKIRNLYEKASVHSRVSLCIKTVEFIIFPFQLQDHDNFDVKAEQFKVELEEFPRNEEGMHRTLVMALQSASLSKDVPGKALMLLYSRPLTSSAKQKDFAGTSMFGIPGTEISMESTQLYKKIDHEFDAAFAGRISVPFNVGLIKELHELIESINISISQALEKAPEHIEFLLEQWGPNSSSSEDGEETGTSRKLSIGLDTSKKTIDTKSSTAPQAPPVTDTNGAANKEDKSEADKPIVEAPVEKYVYTSVKPVNFHPTLQAMGDATPSIEWLGLKRERIPGMIHENITLHLDQFVKVIWNVLESHEN